METTSKNTKSLLIVFVVTILILLGYFVPIGMLPITDENLNLFKVTCGFMSGWTLEYPTHPFIICLYQCRYLFTYECLENLYSYG